MFAVMAVIFCFSAQAGEESSQVSNGVLEFLMKWKPIRWVLEETPVLDLLPLRKWGHFTVYFLLGITSFGWMRQVAGSLRHSVAGAAAICFLYACSDEFHQLFVPGCRDRFHGSCVWNRHLAAGTMDPAAETAESGAIEIILGDGER